MWKKSAAKPEQCLIGCPHLSLEQINAWTGDIISLLKAKNKKRVKVETILSAPPGVLRQFKKDSERMKALSRAGVQITEQCPLMFLINPLSGNRRVITPSNKLRTYTRARYFTDEEILEMITG